MHGKLINLKYPGITYT